MNKKSIIKKAFIDTVPIMSAYMVLGLGFGVLAYSCGYGVLLVLCMSIFIYGGSMQYVGIELMHTGAGLFSVFVMSLIVQARYMFYAISMIGKYKNIKKHKLYTIFALTDEAYSILSLSKEKDESYYFLVSLFNHIYWIVGTILGVLVGRFVNINTKGIEFSMTALFITAFINAWKEAKGRKYQLIGIVSSVLCLMIFGEDKFLLASMCLVFFILTIIFLKKERKKDE